MSEDEIAELRDRLARIEADNQQIAVVASDDNRVDFDDMIREGSAAGRVNRGREGRENPK